MAGLLFQKDFFFKGNDLNEQIIKIAEVFGYGEFEKFINKYQDDVRINKKILEKIKNYEKKEWKSFVNENNKYLINDEVIDLLEKLLKFDPEERIKAKDAIKHPYFKEINSDSED